MQLSGIQITMVKPSTFLVICVIIGGILPVSFSPLISRIYDPVSFSEIGKLMAYNALVIPLISMRLDNVLLKAELDHRSEFYNVISFSSINALVIFLILLIPYLYGAVEYSLIVSVFSSLTVVILTSYVNFLTNKGEIKKIGFIKLFRPLFEVIFSMMLSTFLIETGLLVSYFSSFLVIVGYFLITERFFFWKKANDYFIFLKRNLYFIKFELPSGLFVSLSNNALFYGCLLMYSDEVLGYVAFAMKYLNAPLGLLSSSITVLFRNNAVKEINSSGSSIYSFVKFFKLLLFLSLLFIFILFNSDYIFPIIFGEEWYEAGRIASVVCFLFGIKIISTPLSSILYILDLAKLRFILQFSVFIASFLSISLAYWFSLGVYGYIYTHTIILSSIYFLYLIVCYSASLNGSNRRGG
ncbi:hypothetical protein ACXP2N_14620 [Vibrio alginolyticus]|uniref:hypothetical protein n=1 Tax=Vibrio alginolyticus TaxID=663 RepID=UPI001BD2864B|nr:hypothetical protein [Vibrio alginolyticus]MBS9847122.1 hypothetical protein [Vibrio alginolyticus]